MKIAIGSDHAGFELKEKVGPLLEAAGHEVLDVGTDSEEPVDYPDFCAAAARAVVDGRAERGILLGGSGQGEQIAANKVPGVRAALCNDLYLAELARRHNDANVLTLGGRVTPPDTAARLVRIFLDTPFEGGRHQRRVDKITALERKNG